MAGAGVACFLIYFCGGGLMDYRSHEAIIVRAEQCLDAVWSDAGNIPNWKWKTGIFHYTDWEMAM